MIALSRVVPAAATCPPVARAACRIGGTNLLSIFNDSNDARDRLTWSWLRGPATAQADFGDPTATTAYSLCVYDAFGLVFSAEIAAGGTCNRLPCWRTTGTTGFFYRDGAGAVAGIQVMRLSGSTHTAASVSVSARGVNLPDLANPLSAPITVQLSQSPGAVCFESVFNAGTIARNDGAQVRARSSVTAATSMPTLPSVGCGDPLATYTPGVSTATSLMHDGLARTFRVYLPPSYPTMNDTPVPVVFLLHGGFGSGAQVENSSRLLEVADDQGFVVVSPDGVAGSQNIRTWNAGGCCGFAASSGVDDVGFIAAMLDQLEATLCLDRRRVYAAGMSNGAMLSDRLACDLADRIRAIGAVAGSHTADPCTPARPVPVLHIHGTGDQNVPYAGGFGCGLAGVPFASMPDTIAGWTARDGCSGRSTTALTQGDGTCVKQGPCAGASDVELCTIPNGGHHWPGGLPPVISGIGNCPFGYQSQSFSASVVLWDFFRQHPPR
jgi:polyhydroxybutyrate depolymerase